MTKHESEVYFNLKSKFINIDCYQDKKYKYDQNYKIEIDALCIVLHIYWLEISCDHFDSLTWD